MEVWKIIFLSKWVICMFHVNLPECIYIYIPKNLWGANGRGLDVHRMGQPPRLSD